MRQLIYTSARRGLTPGQSGYCTVARSRDLREALIPRIEKLSYYTPETNRNPIICAHRILDIRGANFHVLSRIVDAGLDFTKRRGFVAHHLIFEPPELELSPLPAEIFLKWKGWLEHWEGDPQWIEENAALPPHHPSLDLIPHSVWLTGNEEDRKNFLQFLIDRRFGWETTFTNCFQPGDDPNDFHIKAAWPNTPGFGTAQRLDVSFTDVKDVPILSRPIVSTQAPAIIAPESLTPETPLPEPLPRPSRLWPAVAGALLLITLAASVFYRQRADPPTLATPAPPPPLDLAPSLDAVFPDRPTWLIVPDANGRFTPPQPLEDLMRQLRANEIFTKDLTASIQPWDRQAPAWRAPIFADPQQNLLRFGEVDLILANPAHLITTLRESFAIEIQNRFRLHFLSTPLELPTSFLQRGATITLDPNLEHRIRLLQLPASAQLALRPIPDPLAPLEHDFALAPSTTFDLAAVQTQVSKIITAKSLKLQSLQSEQSSLIDEQKKSLTKFDPKSEKRLDALNLDIPRIEREPAVLKAKAQTLPTDLSGIKTFAIFLCLSNVNTEMIRFIDKP